MKGLLLGFLAGLLAMAGIAAMRWNHWLHWPSPVPTPKSTTVPVGEVVEDIRALNRLVVFQAYITAVTHTSEAWFGPILVSKQTMISPSYVNYFIEMGDIKTDAVSFKNNHLSVRLPPLKIERPNIDTTAVEIVDEGMWMDLSNVEKRLVKKNQAMAVQQLFKRAQKPFLVQNARHQAVLAVYNNTRKILNASRHPEVSLTVSF